MTTAITFTRRTVLCAPVVLVACKRSAVEHKLMGSTMGTTYSITALDNSRSVAGAELRGAVEDALASVNTQMSNWDSESEISRLNAVSGAMDVSPELAQVLKAAEQVHDASAGQFDVALGSLIDAWGFGANGIGLRTPSEAEIETAMASASAAAPMLVEGTLILKSDASSQANLSGIGKGHGVDRVAKAIEKLGIQDYMVEIGGDLFTAGRNGQGRAWQIGVETPDATDRAVMQIVGVSDLGMATSGDYRNYFEKDGQRFSHILDASTGRPVTHTTASATVLADDAMRADAWSTAMLTLGSERGMEIAEAEELAVMFIDRSADDAFVTRCSSRFDAAV